MLPTGNVRYGIEVEWDRFEDIVEIYKSLGYEGVPRLGSYCRQVHLEKTYIPEEPCMVARKNTVHIVACSVSKPENLTDMSKLIAMVG